MAKTILTPKTPIPKIPVILPDAVPTLTTSLTTVRTSTPNLFKNLPSKPAYTLPVITTPTSTIVSEPKIPIFPTSEKIIDRVASFPKITQFLKPSTSTTVASISTKNPSTTLFPSTENIQSSETVFTDPVLTTTFAPLTTTSTPEMAVKMPSVSNTTPFTFLEASSAPVNLSGFSFDDTTNHTDEFRKTKDMGASSEVELGKLSSNWSMVVGSAIGGTVASLLVLVGLGFFIRDVKSRMRAGTSVSHAVSF